MLTVIKELQTLFLTPKELRYPDNTLSVRFWKHSAAKCQHLLQKSEEHILLRMWAGYACYQLWRAEKSGLSVIPEAGMRRISALLFSGDGVITQWQKRWTFPILAELSFSPHCWPVQYNLTDLTSCSLSSLGFLSHNKFHQKIFRRHKLITLSPGGWKSQDDSISRLSVWWGLVLRFKHGPWYYIIM